MTKLRPVEEVATGSAWMEYARRVEILKADRQAVVQVCADAYRRVAGKFCVSKVVNAILHAIDPPVSERERLGRKMFEILGTNMAPWEQLTLLRQEQYCCMAEDILAEQQKIQEERGG